LVTLYQTIGGDTLLQATPVCTTLPSDRTVGTPAPFCSPA
jgi:hypothetical protein